MPVDLAELTIAGATLPNFVVRVRQAVPDGAELRLWRTKQTTRWVLRVTDMGAIATLRDESIEPPAVSPDSWACLTNGYRGVLNSADQFT